MLPVDSSEIPIRPGGAARLGDRNCFACDPGSCQGGLGVLLAVIGAVLLVALYAGMFGFAAYLDRRVFPHGLDLNFKSGWLVIGVILGACVGCIFSGSRSDVEAQRLESPIHTMEGALVGVGIGMIVDLARNLPRIPIRFQFRLWHIPAFVYIFAVCFFVLLEFIDLLRLRSTLCY